MRCNVNKAVIHSFGTIWDKTYSQMWLLEELCGMSKISAVYFFFFHWQHVYLEGIYVAYKKGLTAFGLKKKMYNNFEDS